MERFNCDIVNIMRSTSTKNEYGRFNLVMSSVTINASILNKKVTKVKGEQQGSFDEEGKKRK